MGRYGPEGPSSGPYGLLDIVLRHIPLAHTLRTYYFCTGLRDQRGWSSSSRRCRFISATIHAAAVTYANAACRKIGKCDVLSMSRMHALKMARSVLYAICASPDLPPACGSNAQINHRRHIVGRESMELLREELAETLPAECARRSSSAWSRNTLLRRIIRSRCCSLQ